MSDIAIRVENVSKKFATRMRYVMMYGALDIAASFCGVNLKTDQLRKGEFFAVNDISFEVKKGEAVGLIGANGAGKSTMLKMLNGIYMPDKGHIEMHGKVGALIEVGAGFHPMLTGRENIYINGSILGLKKKELDKKLDSIIDFSGLEEFIDMPVKHYSSGMYVRLGFAIAAHCNPEILLVDEMLAVGDAKFRRKCLDYLLKLQKQGTTFIIVSHNMQTLEGVTTKGIVFKKGAIVFDGNAVDAISRYDLEMYTADTTEDKQEVQPDFEEYPDSLPLLKYVQEYGTHDVHIKCVKIFDKNKEVKKSFHSNEPVIVQAIVDSKVSTKSRIRMSFRNEDDLDCLGTIYDFQLNKGLQKIEMRFDPIQLTTGKYKIIFVLHDESLVNPYCNGFYGNIDVVNISSSHMKGTYTPHCWAYPKISITDDI